MAFSTIHPIELTRQAVFNQCASRLLSLREPVTMNRLLGLPVPEHPDKTWAQLSSLGYVPPMHIGLLSTIEREVRDNPRSTWTRRLCLVAIKFDLSTTVLGFDI